MSAKMEVDESGPPEGDEAKKTDDSEVPPPRFEIKKWNAVCMWSWDICESLFIAMHAFRCP